MKDLIKISFDWLEIFYKLFAEYYYVLPEFLLANVILLLLCYGIFVFRANDKFIHTFLNYTLIFVFGLLGLVLLLLLTLPSDLQFYNVNNLIFFWDQFTIDSLALTFKFLLLLAFICVLVLVRVYLVQQKIYVFEYVFLMLTSLLGSFFIISANDFLLLYLAIELQSLSFYVLAAFNTRSKFSAEAAIKYFIIGSVASAFYLFGVAFIYGVTGTTNFYSLQLCIANIVVTSSKPLTIGFIFLLVGLLIKIGAAPFHMWVPDVYQGSPLPVMALFATVPKIVLLSVFFRLVYYVAFTSLNTKKAVSGLLSESVIGSASYFFDGFYVILASNLFWGVGLLSVIVSVIGGLGQTHLKRLFAYSSIGNIGFIFLALSTNTVESIHVALVYLVIYILLSLNFFLILVALRYATRISIVYISDLNRLKPSFLQILLALNLFSLAGIPPLAGFYNKFYVYYILMANANYLTTLIVIIFTIGSTFYYIRLISALFFGSVSLTTAFKQIRSVKIYFEAPTMNVKLQRDLVVLVGITSYLNLFALFHFSTLFNLLHKLVLSFF